MSIHQNQIDDYISTFPEKVQKQLKELKSIIKTIVPEAEETISYAMPTFKLMGNLVHFAGYKNHIGFYPAPSAIIQFEKELFNYNTSKGAIQFPIGEPLPTKLIEKIVRFRVEENKLKLGIKVKRK
jgi:uncharacterized protein YdhG (YjbR/CyaY superfamily)